MNLRPLLFCLALLSAAAGCAEAQEASPPQGAAPVTAIRAGRLIDGSGGPVVENAVIIVRGERIESVGPAAGAVIPGGARVVDLSRHTVLPGLIDGHAHPYENLNWGVPDAIRMGYIAQGMRISLLSGTTTYYVLGEIHNMDIVARGLVEQGRLAGPRIYPSGHWILTSRGPWGEVFDETYDGADAIRAKIREQHQAGAHHTKLMLEDGAGSGNNFTREELRAAVEQSHALGMKVTAHAYGDAVRVAMEAGVDAVTHGNNLTPETIDLLKRRRSGIVVTHTIDFQPYYPERWRVAGQTTNAKEWLQGWRDVLARARREPSVERAFRARARELTALKAAGVIVAAGTDNGPGLMQIELEYLVDSGFTPLEAITAGTGATARLLGIDQEVGTIQRGRFADIIAVSGRPDQDIKALDQLSFLMAGGRDLSGLSWK